MGKPFERRNEGLDTGMVKKQKNIKIVILAGLLAAILIIVIINVFNDFKNKSENEKYWASRDKVERNVETLVQNDTEMQETMKSVVKEWKKEVEKITPLTKKLTFLLNYSDRKEFKYDEPPIVIKSKGTDINDVENNKIRRYENIGEMLGRLEHYYLLFKLGKDTPVFLMTKGHRGKGDEGSLFISIIKEDFKFKHLLGCVGHGAEFIDLDNDKIAEIVVHKSIRREPEWDMLTDRLNEKHVYVAFEHRNDYGNWLLYTIYKWDGKTFQNSGQVVVEKEAK